MKRASERAHGWLVILIALIVVVKCCPLWVALFPDWDAGLVNEEREQSSSKP